MDYDLDPELAVAALTLPSFDLSDIPGMRALSLQISGAAPQYESERELRVDDIAIPGYAGVAKVGVRIYKSSKLTSPVPGLILLHGGAFVMGDLDMVDNQARQIADRAGVVVVSVEYRLAPENPYPAALDDSYAALLWMDGKGGRDYGIDRSRIGVLGESAGGGLAAALALVTRDRGGPRLVAQFLDTPAVDDRLETHSMRNLPDTPFWSSSDAPYIWKHYLGKSLQSGSASVPLYAAPGRAELKDLIGLPPAWVAAYQVDPMRDEVLNYAQKLIQAGVSTELHHYSGAFHVAYLVPGTAIGARMLEERLAAIKRLLNTAV